MITKLKTNTTSSYSIPLSYLLTLISENTIDNVSGCIINSLNYNYETNILTLILNKEI